MCVAVPGGRLLDSPARGELHPSPSPFRRAARLRERAAAARSRAPGSRSSSTWPRVRCCWSSPLVNGTLRHHAFTHELSQWDGLWYRELADHGYPTHVVHEQSTLGFFPLYPMRRVAHLARVRRPDRALRDPLDDGRGSDRVRPRRPDRHRPGRTAGRELVGRSGRPARVLLFCLFPGSVVFSMVYAEGMMIPLAAGCILALQRRRWVLAGALAGLATATEPQALVLVLVCAVSAALELRRHRSHLRALLAPALSLVGAVSFAAFLWIWTGSPFASLIAQRDGWSERTDLFALVHLTEQLGDQISFKPLQPPDDRPQPGGRAGRRDPAHRPARPCRCATAARCRSRRSSTRSGSRGLA